MAEAKKTEGSKKAVDTKKTVDVKETTEKKPAADEKKPTASAKKTDKTSEGKKSTKWKLYSVEGGKISRKSKFCPKCGDGVFMASHKDRNACGKCGYTEFKIKN